MITLQRAQELYHYNGIVADGYTREQVMDKVLASGATKLLLIMNEVEASKIGAMYRQYKAGKLTATQFVNTVHANCEDEDA